MEIQENIARLKKLKTREDVADILGIKERSLRFFLYKRRPENMYRTFKIQKKDGTCRTISAPNDKLKHIQRKLADVLSEVYSPKICAYGFVPGKSIVGNAEQHSRKRLVLNVDLKDFFDQIHFGRVRGMFMAKPYSLGVEAATTIAQISCFNGVLPQGAPSSPIITNMICVPLDNALIRLAKQYDCVYTRYADDITFSTTKKCFDPAIVYTDDNGIHIGEKLDTCLKRHSFEVNPSKITLREKSSRQEVTGLTVNEFPNVRRSYIRQLRAILDCCQKYGIYSAAKTYIEKGLCKNNQIKAMAHEPKYEEAVVYWFRNVLEGKIRYICQVKGDNNLTYLAAAQKFNRIVGETVFDVSALDRLNELVENSTYVLKYDHENDYLQGSAFLVDKLGLFTSFHVTETGMIFKVLKVGYTVGNFGAICNEINMISSDRDIDYAVYRPPFSIEGLRPIQLGNSQNIKIGDQVTLVGYPKYTDGDSATVQTCYVTSMRSYMGAPFWTVSGRIAHGASGGVVLDKDLKAIGIIKGGVDSLEEDETNDYQGFVPINLAVDHMRQLLYESV